MVRRYENARSQELAYQLNYVHLYYCGGSCLICLGRHMEIRDARNLPAACLRQEHSRTIRAHYLESPLPNMVIVPSSRYDQSVPVPHGFPWFQNRERSINEKKCMFSFQNRERRLFFVRIFCLREFSATSLLSLLALCA